MRNLESRAYVVMKTYVESWSWSIANWSDAAAAFREIWSHNCSDDFEVHTIGVPWFSCRHCLLLQTRMYDKWLLYSTTTARTPFCLLLWRWRLLPSITVCQRFLTGGDMISFFSSEFSIHLLRCFAKSQPELGCQWAWNSMPETCAAKKCTAPPLLARRIWFDFFRPFNTSFLCTFLVWLRCFNVKQPAMAMPQLDQCYVNSGIWSTDQPPTLLDGGYDVRFLDLISSALSLPRSRCLWGFAEHNHGGAGTAVCQTLSSFFFFAAEQSTNTSGSNMFKLYIYIYDPVSLAPPPPVWWRVYIV